MLPARAIFYFRAATLMLLFGLAGSFGAHAVAAQSKTPDSSVSNVPVFVSDFELYAVEPRLHEHAADTPEKRNPSAIYDDTDVPSMRARRLTDFFLLSLVEAFNKKGFSATRSGGQKVPAGALIRGVFAEPDAKNRIRRALLGGNSPSARFFLYVGIINMARQDQPLYQLAPVQSPSEHYGPVITLNAYIPLAKYELDKNPSEEDVRRICDQIVASLISLLEKNPQAFSQ